MARNVLGTYKTSGIPVRQPGASSFGIVIFADADNGNDDTTGNAPTNAVASVEQAVDQAAINGVDATIIVRRGFYSPDKVMALTSSHNGIRIISDNLAPSYARKSNIIYNIGGPDDIFTLNGCHNAEIAGFRFYPEFSVAGSSGIKIANTSSAYGTWVHDNFFYNIEDYISGTGTGTNIHMGATGDAQYTYINKNVFYHGGAPQGSTVMGQVTWQKATRACIDDNIFIMGSNLSTMYSIMLMTATNDMPRGVIINNHFFAAEEDVATVAGYAIYNSEALTGGDFYIANNWSVNYTAAFHGNVTLDESSGLNYVNETVEASD